MPSSRPADRLGDIIENIDAIVSYMSGMSKEEVFADRKTYDAMERCLERISEAATKLGLLAEELAPDQPWKEIRGIGNWLRHDYPNVVKDVIWKTVNEDLGRLRTDCVAARRRLEGRK